MGRKIVFEDEKNEVESKISVLTSGSGIVEYAEEKFKDLTGQFIPDSVYYYNDPYDIEGYLIDEDNFENEGVREMRAYEAIINAAKEHDISSYLDAYTECNTRNASEFNTAKDQITGFINGDAGFTYSKTINAIKQLESNGQFQEEDEATEIKELSILGMKIEIIGTAIERNLDAPEMSPEEIRERINEKSMDLIVSAVSGKDASGELQRLLDEISESKEWDPNIAIAAEEIKDETPEEIIVGAISGGFTELGMERREPALISLAETICKNTNFEKISSEDACDISECLNEIADKIEMADVRYIQAAIAIRTSAAIYDTVSETKDMAEEINERSRCIHTHYEMSDEEELFLLDYQDALDEAKEPSFCHFLDLVNYYDGEKSREGCNLEEEIL